MASIREILALLEDEMLTARELGRALGMSQPTVSRLLKAAGEQVIRIGSGRSTRYAAARPLFGGGGSQPLYAVDEAGVVSEIAVLRGITRGKYLVEAKRPTFWLLGQAGNGLFDSLPYFLYDLRPSGFLGRQLARRLAAEWGYPADPRLWGDEHIGQYLIRLGDDLPGNLVLGEAVAARVQIRGAPVVTDREREYPRLAQLALSGELPGSSAAGEQPKFTVQLAEGGHVIVKFSPVAKTADAQRWRDLLLAEHHAELVVREQGVPAAETSLYDFEDRFFLESRRFDRHGALGRSAALSLAVVDLEFAGEGLGWARVGRTLQEQGLLDRGSCDQLAWMETFGEWIGNTDMHLGNISLAPTEQGFRLLPLYDMLPMAFASMRGELPEVRLAPPVRRALTDQIWASAGRAAVSYWLRLADDGELSDNMRSIAQRWGTRWRELVGRE